MTNQNHSVPESSPELNYLMESISSFIQATVNSALSLMKNSPHEKLIVDMPLLNTYSFFKGKKPMAIIGISEEPIPTTNWRQVAEVLIKDCVNNDSCREYLMSQRGLISGRNRVIISSEKSTMDVPLEICPNLYFECKFDTEMLLKVMVNRVLLPAGYDIENIKIRVGF